MYRTHIAQLAAAIGVLVALLALAAPTPALAGQFGVRCTFSHRLYDDPIVHPGAPGASHLHDFFGSTAAKATVTRHQMLQARTTCSDRGDTAGYWHPRAFFGGVGQTATVTAWYSKGGKPTVRAFPPGIKLVAGDMMATERQSRRVLYWQCSGPGRHHKVRFVPRCNHRQHLTANLVFPDCWDGEHKDSADHHSHAAYSRKGSCPAGFSAPLPRLTLVIEWRGHPTPSTVSVASGSYMTMHADFWNTWHQNRLRSLVNGCVNVNDDCGIVDRPPHH